MTSLYEVKNKGEQKRLFQVAMSECNLEKYTDVLEKGTVDELYKMGQCIVNEAVFVKKASIMAEKLFRKAADKGHIEAAYDTYWVSSGLGKKSGLKYLKIAAKEGHTLANKALANCYLYGNGLCKDEIDPVKAVEVLRELVKTDTDAYSILGKCYENGVGVIQDFTQAKRFYVKSTAKSKKTELRQINARIKAQDTRELKDILEKCRGDKYADLLENGSSEEQLEMADCLESERIGRIMKNTKKMSKALIQKAAESGNSEGMYKMHLLSKNKATRLKYLKLAAAHGHRKATLYLVDCYLYGNTYNCENIIDPPKGFRILEDLVKEKDETAYVWISKCYEKGVGVPINLEMAKKFMRKSSFVYKSDAIRRINMVIEERDNPSKELRKKIATMYPYNYKIVDDKVVHL